MNLSAILAGMTKSKPASTATATQTKPTATNAINTSMARPSVSPAEYARQQMQKQQEEERQALQKFRIECDRKVGDFVKSELTELKFDVEQKRPRILIIEEAAYEHDVVCHSENINCDESTGEDIVQITLYKKGYEPADDEIKDDEYNPYQQIAMQETQMKLMRAAKRSKVSAQNTIPTKMSGPLIVLNTQKRDRRSIEEIQKEIKSRKHGVTGEEDDYAASLLSDTPTTAPAAADTSVAVSTTSASTTSPAGSLNVAHPHAATDGKVKRKRKAEPAAGTT